MKVFFAPRTGGTFQLLVADVGSVSRLRITPTELLYVHRHRLFAVPKSGGAVRTLAIGLRGEAGFDVAEGAAYFFTVRGLERVLLTGGHRSLVIAAAELSVPVDALQLEIQGRFLAVVATVGNELRILRAPLSGGASQVVLASNVAEYPSAVSLSERGVALARQGATDVRTLACGCP